MKLNAKLVMIMLSLLIITMLTLFVMNQYTQNELVHEIQESSTEVSKAIQISVEDLTSDTDVKPSRLKDYIKGARNKGINEINIISNEGEIISSTDPAKVGKRREIKKTETGLKAARIGRGAPSMPQRPYELVVPVIVGDEQLGYVQINLLLDKIRDIQRENFIKRLVATCMIFMFGILLTIFLARRYTDPINRLVQEVKKVSSGDLSVTFPVQSGDEIGELAESFNEMVEQLRERESLEKRLFEAEHLSKVGQLASGIAHEIRNPLNYINLAIDHLKSEVLSAGPTRREEIEGLTDKIKEEVRRANYMVINFMNYGRPLKLRVTEFSYSDLIGKTLPLLQDKLGEQHIEVKTLLDPDLPLMQADQEMMRNCLLNFITNGAQAMPEGGVVTLGAGFDRERGLFLLTFADQGEGIATDDMAKIFQPYFTTKEAGIGLGLAITERIIKEHGGTIEVASSAGEGTTFTVILPMHKEQAQVQEEAQI